MDIWNGNLRVDLLQRQKIICKIDLKMWYKIVVDVDCINHEYSCTIINLETNLISEIKQPLLDGFRHINNIRSKYFNTKLKWDTFIAGVKVVRYE